MQALQKQSNQSITTSDGVKLAYLHVGSRASAPVVVLIHGWSGSKAYWELNVGGLARHCKVYAYDQRFHGESGKPRHGHHVHRLAKDLKDFLEALNLEDVTVVGASMGASVIWAYIELFGHHHLKQAVFVDQAPLQNRAEDWNLGSHGCYDAVSLARLQCTLKYDFNAVAQGNMSSCLSSPLRPEVATALQAETLRADPEALGRLMADHTQLDWRPLLPQIQIPCLNIVGMHGGCFNPAGVEYVGQQIPQCETVRFQANHWLYLENPKEFNELVVKFSYEELAGVAALQHF